MRVRTEFHVGALGYVLDIGRGYTVYNGGTQLSRMRVGRVDQFFTPRSGTACILHKPYVTSAFLFKFKFS